jgi:hypothetical protein
MTLPSLTEVSNFTAATMRRFTISVLAAFVAAILAVKANLDGFYDMGGLYPYIMTCLFAFPFALAVDVFVESKKFGLIGKIFAKLFQLVVIGGAYYFVFRNLQENFEIDGLKSFLMFLSATVLVFLAPFFCTGRANAFWQFSIAVVARFFQTFLYFAILFIGIVLLIQSVNYLFQLELDEKYFADAWFIITGIFASVYGLAGVPSNYKSLDQTTAYPKFLRVLTEYFLVPLVTLYLIVLYAYSAKILFTWEWPLGGVAAWVMGFSAVGVLTYFFIYSIKEKFLGYVEFYKKWFFVFLLPLLVVLGLSIWIRIQNYGVTQDRYFVVAFGVWALILATFYLISRSRNLKFMVASLFVILLLTMYGPQSVFELPRLSQMARLEKILVQNGILVDGKVVKIDDSKLTQDDGYAINSIMNYIASSYGTDGFQSWFTQDLNAINPQYPGDYWSKVIKMEEYMGIEINKFPGPYGGAPGTSSYRNFYVNPQACNLDNTVYFPVACSLDVRGYNYYFAMELYGYDGNANPHFMAGDQEYVTVVKDQKVITIQNSKTQEVLVTVDLKAFVDNLLKKYPFTQEIPAVDMMVTFDKGRLRFNNVNAYIDSGNFKNVDSMSVVLLLK